MIVLLSMNIQIFARMIINGKYTQKLRKIPFYKRTSENGEGVGWFFVNPNCPGVDIVRG